MSPKHYDFARCPLCDYATPIRPSKPVAEEAGQIRRGKDAELVFVACLGCKRVYSFDLCEAESIPATEGLSPYDPAAPMHVFPVPLYCDEPNCDTPLLVIAVRMTDTSNKALRSEAAGWRWESLKLKCPRGYGIPWPQTD